MLFRSRLADTQGCAPVVQVADYGGVGHRAVGIVEDNGEKVALIGIRDLRQSVDVAVEAGVLGGFRGHAATVSARSASTPRSKRAPARTKATRWGALTAPTFLGGLDELERHGQHGGPGPGAPADLRSQPHGRERRSIGFVVRTGRRRPARLRVGPELDPSDRGRAADRPCTRRPGGFLNALRLLSTAPVGDLLAGD